MAASNDLGDLPPVAELCAPEWEAEVARLAALDPVAYENVRRGTAHCLGWRTTTLDDEVRKARLISPNDTDRVEKNAGDIEKLAPWPDPVDGIKLAEEIRACLRAYVVFGAAGDADAATVWIFGTYLMDVWRLWPRLLITSPTKACGKSTLLEVLDALVLRGFIAANASPSAVFRVIAAWAPTLLLDEADTWMAQNQELAGILNSGHTRRTARVIRVTEVKGEHVPVAFSTWCAMVIAGIGAQRDTLMSRSIVIGLRRRLPEERVERLPIDLNSRLLDIRRKLVRWADDSALEIAGMEVEPPDCGDDRRRDNWTPLHRIAAALSGPWPARIAAAFAAQAQSQDDDTEPAGVMMLRDVSEVFAARGVDRIATSDLVADLLAREDRPWTEWRNGGPITAQTVAKLMKPFGIKAAVKKVGGTATRVYLCASIEAAAARYVTSMRNSVTL